MLISSHSLVTRFQGTFKANPEKAILTLDFVKKSVGSMEIVLGKVSGSIDANTLPKFRAEVESYLTGEQALLLIEASGLRYVNSSGMGALIKMATEFTSAGGIFSMAAVPVKIANLFKMLGILDVLMVYNSVEDGLKEIQSSFGSPEKPFEEDLRRKFPIFIQCIGCGRRIEIPSHGYFSCPRCATYFSVKDTGVIRGYKIDKPIHAELTLPANPEMAQGLRSVASGLAALRGYSRENIKRIHQILDETATILSLGSTQSPSVFVIYLVADSREFRAAIKTEGDLFDRTKSPVVTEHLQVIRGLVDDLGIVTLPMGGQILKLVKKVDEE